MKELLQAFWMEEEAVAVVEIFSIKTCNFSFLLKNIRKPFIYQPKQIL